MLATVLISAFLFLLAIAGLALGTIFGRAPLKGSCGGLGCSGLDCAACPRRRKTEQSP